MIKKSFAAALAFVVSFSCFSTAFNAETSVATRAVELQSYQYDGSYASKTDEQAGKYAIELMKTTEALNKLKLIYTVDSTSTVDDLPEKIKLFIPNSTVSSDAKVETNKVEALGSQIGVSSNGLGTTLEIPIVRTELIKITNLELIVPFKLNVLTDPTDTVVTLVSKDNIEIPYKWNVILKEIGTLPDMTLKDRLNANTGFAKDNIAAITGMKYILPLNVQSISDEQDVTIKVTHNDFYFKDAVTGQWTDGYGNYTVSDLKGGVPKAIPIEVFCAATTTNPFTLSVNGENLKASLPVSKDTVSLDYTGTDTNLTVGRQGNLIANFHYGEDSIGHNTFNFDVTNYDSSKYTIDNASIKVDVDTKTHTTTFTAPYTPKKAYANELLHFQVNTTFEGQKYALSEIDVPLTSTGSDTLNPLKDFSITAQKTGERKITMRVSNNGTSSGTATVTMKADNPAITLSGEGITTGENGKYRFEKELQPGSTNSTLITVDIPEDLNTGNSAQQVSITFNLDADDVDKNNSALVTFTVPPQKDTGDVSITKLSDITDITENTTLKGAIELSANSTAKEDIINLTLRLSDSGVELDSDSPYVNSKQPSSNVIKFSVPISANRTVSIPYTLTTAKGPASDVKATLTANIENADALLDNNTATHTFIVRKTATPDITDPIPPAEHLEDRLNEGTRFLKDLLASKKGVIYNIPLEIRSNKAERPFDLTISNQNFRFKVGENWMQGTGVYRIPELKKDVAHTLTVQAYAINDNTNNPFTVLVNGTQLSTTMNVTNDVVTLTDNGSDLEIPKGSKGYLRFALRYNELYVGNNNFDIEFTGDISDKCSLDRANIVASHDSTRKLVEYTVPYIAKSIYTQMPIDVSVTTNLEGNKTVIGSKTVELTATHDTSHNRDLGVAASLAENESIIHVVLSNNSNIRDRASLTIIPSMLGIELQSDDSLVKGDDNTYTLTTDINPGDSISKDIRIILSPDANNSSEDKTCTVNFSLPNDDNISNNTDSVSFVIPGNQVDMDFSIEQVGNITDISNGMTKSTSFIIENKSLTSGKVVVEVEAIAEGIDLYAQHKGAQKIGKGRYRFTIDMYANARVSIPYSIIADNNANMTEEDLTFQLSARIVTADANLANNSMTKSVLLLAPNKPPVTGAYDLKDYFDLSITTTPVIRGQQVIATLNAEQKKPLPTIFSNGVITLEVLGDVQEHNGSGNLTKVKRVKNLDLSSIVDSITFTPINIGEYQILATVSSDNITNGGEVRTTHVFTIDQDSGIYPPKPLEDSNAVSVKLELSSIENNEGTLKLSVTNNTEYIVRNTYVNLDYSKNINLRETVTPTTAIVRGDYLIGNLPPSTTKEWTFNVEVLKTGRTKIVAALNSVDINTEVYIPSSHIDVELSNTTKPDKPVTHTVSGIVFNDIDGNGVLDINEDGIANATVRLCETSGVVLREMRTVSSGYYSFDNLRDGDYVIKVGYLDTISSKNLSVQGTDISNFNVPIDKKSNNDNDSNQNGNNDNKPIIPDVASASVGLSARVVENNQKYAVVEVTAKNNSQIGTRGTISVVTQNVIINNNDWNNTSTNMFSTNLIELLPYSSKTFTMHLSKTDKEGKLNFTLTALSDLTQNDNTVSITIPTNTAIVPPVTPTPPTPPTSKPSTTPDVADGNGSHKEHNSAIDNVIADFGSTPNTPHDTPNTSNIPNVPHNVPITHNTQDSAHNTPHIQQGVSNTTNVPNIPKTGDLSRTVVNITSLTYLLGGMLTLCGGLLILTYKKDRS